MIVMKNCALVLFHKIMMFETLAICWEKREVKNGKSSFSITKNKEFCLLFKMKYKVYKNLIIMYTKKVI